mmetsp:Transcript_2467/g.3829  ORF Transcript_2467/g.3829 Transcript_2467/m.3829 type:complete len:93 (-) Transcript_2467:787-1065(-)
MAGMHHEGAGLVNRFHFVLAVQLFRRMHPSVAAAAKPTNIFSDALSHVFHRIVSAVVAAFYWSCCGQTMLGNKKQCGLGNKVSFRKSFSVCI